MSDCTRVREGNLPWDRMFTLRVGEAVHAPYADNAFYLPDERIKLRECSDSTTCVFLDEDTNACGIYEHRPEQCRLQQCWDPAPALEHAQGPFLTRREVFAEAEPLLQLMAEHDRRCSFEALRLAFERIKQGESNAADNAVELLAFDNHVRTFAAERFEMLAHSLDLLFGRPLSHLVRLFGFRVETGPDGTHTLLAQADPAAGNGKNHPP